VARCRRCAEVPEEVRRAASLLERRWLLSVLWAAHSGAVRYNEFLQALGRIPPRTLAARLSELEAEGILERRVVATRPPTVEYRLTPAGERLGIIVEALRAIAATP
jgi:DNA-binding HxlR family transcriptional regulator